MTLYMLDTNAVSASMHGKSAALDRRVSSHAKSELCISAVSYGETLYGLAYRPRAKYLALAAAKIFDLVQILPWTTETAARYGSLRAEMRQIGKALELLDMLIAAHALEAGAVLVSSDTAFRYVPGLTVEDWTAA